MKTISSFFLQVLNLWYVPQDNWLNRWLERLWAPALYLIGLIEWGLFLNWGSIPLDMADWSDITMPRILVLQDAVQRGLLPLHIAAPNGMKGITDRFLAIPDILLSPQVFLLRVIEPGLFLFINIILLYTIGFIGLYWLRKKYRLSLAVFSVLFLLFMFNGHIVDHIYIGHATWMAYFLYPFFALLILRLLEKQPGWKWVYQMVWLLLIIFLQGGFHQYVILLLFLFFLGLFTPRYLKACWGAGIFAILVGLFRILPVSLVSPNLKLGFLGGFTTLNEVFRGMVTLIEPSKVLDNISRLNPYLAWWEIDFYIGWMGLLFITGVLFLAWRKKVFPLRGFSALVYPTVVLAIFSIGRLYKFVFILGIPMLTGERVSTRFWVLPLLISLFAAAICAQRLLDCYPIRLPVQLLFLGGFLVLFNDLQQHTEIWSVSRLSSMTLPSPVDPSLWVVANRPDPSYLTMLVTGTVISILSLLLLSAIRFNQRRTDAWLSSSQYPVEE